MVDIASSTSLMEKLHNDNYDTWNTRIKFYLLRQDLWDVGGVAKTILTTDEEEKKKWKIKAGKVVYVLFVNIEDEFLQRVKDLTTPKDVWDTPTTMLIRMSDAKLQLLENELMSVKQGNMTVGQYFTKECTQ